MLDTVRQTIAVHAAELPASTLCSVIAACATLQPEQPGPLAQVVKQLERRCKLPYRKLPARANGKYAIAVSGPRHRVMLPVQQATQLLWSLAVFGLYDSPLVSDLASMVFRMRLRRRHHPPLPSKMLVEAKLLIESECGHKGWRPLRRLWKLRARRGDPDVFDSRAWTRLEYDSGGISAKRRQALQASVTSAAAALGIQSRWRLLPQGESVCVLHMGEGEAGSTKSRAAASCAVCSEEGSGNLGINEASLPADRCVLCIEAVHHRALNNRRRMLAAASVRNRLLQAQGLRVVTLLPERWARMTEQQRTEYLDDAISADTHMSA